MRDHFGFVCRLLAVLLLIAGVAACKSSSERIDEQSKKENVLTNYVKEPQDKAKNVKNQLESAQNSVAKQAEQISQGE